MLHFFLGNLSRDVLIVEQQEICDVRSNWRCLSWKQSSLPGSAQPNLSVLSKQQQMCGWCWKQLCGDPQEPHALCRETQSSSAECWETTCADSDIKVCLSVAKGTCSGRKEFSHMQETCRAWVGCYRRCCFHSFLGVLYLFYVRHLLSTQTSPKILYK